MTEASPDVPTVVKRHLVETEIEVQRDGSMVGGLALELLFMSDGSVRWKP